MVAGKERWPGIREKNLFLFSICNVCTEERVHALGKSKNCIHFRKSNFVDKVPQITQHLTVNLDRVGHEDHYRTRF